MPDLFSCLSCRGLISHQLVGQRAGSVNLAQSFLYASRIDRDGASLNVTVREIPGQRFDIAVEDNSNHFTLFVDRWRSGVSPDNIGRRYKVERRLQVEFCLRIHPAFRQFVGRLVVVFGRALVSSANLSSEGYIFSILRVAFGLAITEPQREGGIRRLGKSALVESSLGDGGS